MTLLEELGTAVAASPASAGHPSSASAAHTRGSGVVIADGQVLTNAHNLRGDEVTVTFADGRSTARHGRRRRRRRRPRGRRRSTRPAPRRSTGATATALAVGTPVFGGRGDRRVAARASRSASCRRPRARSAAPAAAGSAAASSTPRRSRPARPAARCVDGDGRARRPQHEPDRRRLLPGPAGRRRAARARRRPRPRRVAARRRLGVADRAVARRPAAAPIGRAAGA